MSGFAALLERASARHIPLSVLVELTDRCNFRCAHCYLGHRAAPDGISTARMLRLLDELAAAGTLQLTFSGGEPLLRRDWRELVVRARALGFELRVFSNGALVDEGAAELLAHHYVAVEISVHSMDAALFDAVTGVAGSCARTMRGINLLAAHGVPLKLKLPLTRATVGEVHEVAAFAREIGAEFASEARIIVRRDGDRRVLEQRVPPAELVGYYRLPVTPFAAPAQCPPALPLDRGMCAAGRRTCTILTNGELKACNQMPARAGSILETSFDELWHSAPQLQMLRALQRRDMGECSRCPRLAYCARCPAQALVEDGDLLGPAHWSCEHAAALEEAFAAVRGA